MSTGVLIGLVCRVVDAPYPWGSGLGQMEKALDGGKSEGDGMRLSRQQGRGSWLHERWVSWPWIQAHLHVASTKTGR